MSNADTAKGPSDHRGSSEEVSAEIHLLGCGHGDTILLRLPGNRWILVDCHLRDSATRSRFFDFVKSRNIRRLEYIFQTHPDFDHFCGMVDVLNYFTRDGRSVGCWCDAGLDAVQVRDLIWPDQFSRKEHAKIHDRLDELSDQELIQTVNVNDWTRPMPISPSGYAGRIALFPIAPATDELRRISRSGTRKLGKNPKAKLETNALSIVLVLSLAEGGRECNVLLSADAPTESLRGALKTWTKRAEENDRTKAFRVVKVSHHGSIKSRVPELCDAAHGGVSDRVAAISAGTRRALPDREVIREYLDQKWVVMVTTSRIASARGNHLMNIADKSSRSDSRQQDIRIRWTPSGGLSWEPSSACVGRDSLHLYETKSKQDA